MLRQIVQPIRLIRPRPHDRVTVAGAPGPRATDPTLTTREQEIARLVVDGRSNDEIGAALAIATKTVEGHLRRVFERLGIESRAALSARAVAEGWLDVPTVARRRGPGPTLGGGLGGLRS